MNKMSGKCHLTAFTKHKNNFSSYLQKCDYDSTVKRCALKINNLSPEFYGSFIWNLSSLHRPDIFSKFCSYKNSPVSSKGSQMDWKYTNEPDGKTCLAMNEGRCSWHRGKAIGHNGSKAFLKSQLSNAHISLF